MDSGRRENQKGSSGAIKGGIPRHKTGFAKGKRGDEKEKFFPKQKKKKTRAPSWKKIGLVNVTWAKPERGF